MRNLLSLCLLMLAAPAFGAGFEPLAPGRVRPTGWLKDWCQTNRDGYTGHLDEIDRHFQIAWTTNCMRRGENLSWPNAHEGSWSAEGGAYWFDGLVRLAWQLDDPELKACAKKRLDTVLDRMNPNAILFVHWLDRTKPEHMKEIQAANEGWIGWAAAILGRAIAGYYQASGDERALRALNWAFSDERFFEYGNGKPVPASAWEVYRLGHDQKVAAALDAWCRKGPDFGHIAWRYAKTPDRMEFRPFTQKGHDWRAQHGVLACETAISALRASRWRTGRREWGESVLKWSDCLRANCLQPYGVPVADESWGFTGPDRGTETCTVAADIRLNIELLRQLADGRYGDRAERALFNAGAACTTADFNKHVYVQTPNRTVVENRSDFTCPASARYYLHKNWPLCCTAALTRYLPDFVQHLWMASSDGGAVATMYGPCTVELETSGGVRTKLCETTDYPFGEGIRIEVEPGRPSAFPIRVRIPSWCSEPSIRVNGEPQPVEVAAGFVTLRREWKAGDAVELRFPMKPVVTRGLDRNKGEPGRPWCAVSAGPLLFARNLPGTDENTLAADAPTSISVNPDEVAAQAKLTRRTMPARWKWLPELSPVTMMIPTASGSVELVPYGATLLRLSMFDVDRRVSDADMKRLYDEIRTPFKYGVVLTPEPGMMLDNPNVFRHGDKWYMLYIVFDKLGYETHLAESEDLLHWTKRGCVLPRGTKGSWDAAQADAGPSLMNPEWKGDNTLGRFDGRYWATYIGGAKTGYETDPLSIGIAMTDDPSAARPWERLPKPVLTSSDADVRPFESKTLFRSFVVDDPSCRLGARFVMYYNAKQKGEWVERIGMAVSDDMRNWHRFGGDACVANEGALDHGLCGDPMVRKIGDTFVMFYFGCNWDRKGGGAFETFAASKDLVNWTRWQGQKLIEPSEPWDRVHAHKPWVIKHNGIVYHFYCAVGDRGRVLALATSRNLK